MVDMGPISFYLGLKVEQNQERRKIKLFQPAYIDKVLDKYHLSKVNTVNILMRESESLLPRPDSKATPSERETYYEMTRSLMFFMIETRPNIVFLTSLMSRFAKNSSRQHTKIIKKILRYLNGIRDRDITYGRKDQLFLKGYSDSN